MSTTMSHSELAHVLFASALQQTDDPSPAQVHKAIDELLDTRHGDQLAYLACVAQEAGDHQRHTWHGSVGR